MSTISNASQIQNTWKSPQPSLRLNWLCQASSQEQKSTCPVSYTHLNNRDQQQNGNRQKNDGRNGGKPGQGNRDNRRFNDQTKKQQGQQNRGNERRQQEDKRPNQAAPRVDFKARAAALKAEQNAEYARSSEELSLIHI